MSCSNSATGRPPLVARRMRSLDSISTAWSNSNTSNNHREDRWAFNGGGSSSSLLDGYGSGGDFGLPNHHIVGRGGSNSRRAMLMSMSSSPKNATFSAMASNNNVSESSPVVPTRKDYFDKFNLLGAPEFIRRSSKNLLMNEC